MDNMINSIAEFVKKAPKNQLLNLVDRIPIDRRKSQFTAFLKKEASQKE